MKKTKVLVLTILLTFVFTFTGLAEVGTRSNPYSIGDSFVIEGEDWIDGNMKFVFEILESKRGEQAYKFLLEEDSEYSANRRLDKAENEDKEILLVKIYAKALELEEQPFRINTASLFSVIDSTGSTYNIEASSDSNNPFGEVEEVYKGGEIIGWMTFLIPKGDSPIILVSIADETVFANPEIGEEKKLINLTLNKDRYDELLKEAKEENLLLKEYLLKLLK